MPDFLTTAKRTMDATRKITCYPSTFRIVVIGLTVIILIVEALLAILQEDLTVAESIVKYTTQSSVIFIVVTFLYLSLDAFWCGKEGDKSKLLADVLKASLGVSAIPTGISLVVCAFSDVTLIQKYMSGVEVYIAFAGLSIAAVGLLSTLQGKDDVEKEPEVTSPRDVRKMLKDDKTERRDANNGVGN